MRFSSFFFAAAAAGLAAAEGLTRCGTAEPGDALKVELNEAYFSKVAEVSRVDEREINTYVHVVTSKAKRSMYTKEMVQEQMEVMNDAYAPVGITFLTKSINFTINDDWAAAGQDSPTEQEMKSALRRGTYADLNLYFTSDLPGGLLGFCYFPVANPTSTDLILDGCMCLADSMPNGTATEYNLGYTAVHEVGHFMGLYHVFQGTSCSGSGDNVNDTPLQKTPTQGCPSSQDSCPGAKGVDSIHNYMDYSTDECMYEFTDGQIDRAISIYSQQRAGK
ncbi:hypothetical protein M409DRAFT_21755 [Zasmidium cellare ATCC 36951]|uniref:Peptidase M43 pregnancy-associated plasma-A domain-containing protein n=1 Tax=Zasmidium cellare ATCC 36951 TaxID=1080233 RepID=A0A6A6CQ13_ZASCE|nr:uncharacterized protein M409DRAFT_21755 [Zasmidium cellare ATCC 36951]KAF2168318.1 hypothetical protein M409DRAFT_21755 [Zasmidium cellare ATCC 36951]